MEELSMLSAEGWASIESTILNRFDRLSIDLQYAPDVTRADVKMHVLEHIVGLIRKDPEVADQIMQSEAFLVTVIRNAVADYMRIRNRISYHEPVSTDDILDLEKQDDSFEQVNFVLAFRSMLTDSDMRYAALKVFGHSDEDIAVIMEVSARKVRRHRRAIKKALEKLRT